MIRREGESKKSRNTEGKAQNKTKCRKKYLEIEENTRASAQVSFRKCVGSAPSPHQPAIQPHVVFKRRRHAPEAG